MCGCRALSLFRGFFCTLPSFNPYSLVSLASVTDIADKITTSIYFTSYYDSSRSIRTNRAPILIVFLLPSPILDSNNRRQTHEMRSVTAATFAKSTPFSISLSLFPLFFLDDLDLLRRRQRYIEKYQYDDRKTLTHTCNIDYRYFLFHVVHTYMYRESVVEHAHVYTYTYKHTCIREERRYSAPVLETVGSVATRRTVPFGPVDLSHSTVTCPFLFDGDILFSRLTAYKISDSFFQLYTRVLDTRHNSYQLRIPMEMNRQFCFSGNILSSS